MGSSTGTGTVRRCKTWNQSLTVSKCLRALPLRWKETDPPANLCVSQRGISEKQFNWLLAFCSPTKLHVVLTCLRHQIPTITSLEGIPGFISSRSASIIEHLSYETRGVAPSARLCFPSLRDRAGRLMSAAIQVSPELSSSRGFRIFCCRLQSKVAGRRPGWWCGGGSSAACLAPSSEPNHGQHRAAHALWSPTTFPMALQQQNG